MLILLALSVFAVNAASILDPDLESGWQAFKLQYKKTYDTMEEEKYRMSVFMKSKKEIEEHNERYNKGEVTYKKGVNQFADMLHREVVERYTGVKPSAKKHNGIEPSTYIPPKNVKIPDTFDWREKGAVTPVKDQKNCGSGWAFSAVGALEGQHFLKTKKLVSLSEQNLVDCDENSDGCSGGFPWKSFDYISNNKGIDTENSYPYEGKDGRPCRFNASNVGANDLGYGIVNVDDEEALKAAVANIGPISVVIYVSDALKNYKEGILVDDYCFSFILQALLVVGYGTENNTDYWLLKNSWNVTWGEQGYLKMARNRNNTCGIASLATYPIV